jgi:hypothetical protein
MVNGAGIIRAISTSKIKNRTANIKNFKENPLRAFFEGSNPHSKGEFFSLSFLFLKKIIYDKVGRIMIRTKMISVYTRIIFFF